MIKLLQKQRARRATFIRIWLQSACFLLCWNGYPNAFGGSAASNNTATLPELHSISQIRSLSKIEANRHYPVRLRGVVTYYFRTNVFHPNPADEFTSDMFIQDGTGGNWINLEAGLPEAKPGQLIELTGLTSQVDFAPDIQHPSWKVIGHASFPKPDHPAFDQLASTREDSRWIEVEGVVRSTRNLRGGIVLMLAINGGKTEVFVPDSAGTLPPRIVDSRIRLQGVAGAAFNDRSQLRGVLLFVPTVKNIQILEEALPDPFAVPLVSVTSLLRYTIAGQGGHRVKLAGVVTLQNRGKYLYIRSTEGCILAETNQTTQFRVGDHVEAIGFPTVGTFSPYLQQSTVKLIGHGPAPAPIKASLTELQSGALDAELIQLNAVVLDHIFTTGQRALIVKIGQYVTSANFVDVPQNSSLIEVQPGTKVRLTAVSSVQVDEHETIGFQFLLQSPDSLAIIEGPTWLNRNHILWLLSITLGATLIIAAWLIVMKLRVQEQTNIIRRRLESEASLERRYRSLFERNLAGVYQLQLESGMQDCNDACARILGFGDRAALLRDNGSGTAGLREVLAQLLTSRDKTTASEAEIVCADGSRIWVMLSANRVADFSGSVVEGTIVDITDLRKTAEALTQRTTFLNALLESNPLAIAVMEVDGTVAISNPAFENLFGFTREEMVGNKLSATIIPNDRQHEAERTARSITEGGTLSVVSQRQKKDGSLIDVFSRIVPLKINDVLTAFFAIYEDITARLATERELRSTKDAAEAANKAKSEFLANMSHEIRTPLNGVLLAAELAAAETAEPRQREYLDTIRQSGTALLSLLNDLLDFSKIEAGHMQLENREFSIVDCLAECMRLSEFSARQKGLALTCNIDQTLPSTAIGDSFRLRQVLLNLIGNSTKFTEHGSVTITVGRVSLSSENVVCRFSVTDTGIGIPLEKQKLLFRKFEQADASTTRRFGGTGLGLAISKELVQMMNGRMWVESELGHGSTFHFEATFRCEAVSRSSESELPRLIVPEPLTVKPLHVLLAEDNPVNQRLAIRLLEKQGHAVHAVNDGVQAVSAAGDRHFDVILMDLHMPKMDGAEATRRIRTSESDNQEPAVPIIAMTASAMLADQETCRKAGMNGFLSKPIDVNQLNALLLNLALQESQTVAALEPTADLA